MKNWKPAKDTGRCMEIRRAEWLGSSFQATLRKPTIICSVIHDVDGLILWLCFVFNTLAVDLRFSSCFYFLPKRVQLPKCILVWIYLIAFLVPFRCVQIVTHVVLLSKVSRIIEITCDFSLNYSSCSAGGW